MLRSLPEKNYFWKINAGELIADLLLIAYSVFFSKYLFEGEGFFHSSGHFTILSIYLVMMMFIPWYLGFILARFEEFYKEKRIVTIAAWVFVLVGLFVVVFFFIIMFHTGLFEETTETDSATELLGWFSIFFIVLGPMMGIGGMMASKELIRDGKIGESMNFLGAMLAITLSIFFLCWWGFTMDPDYFSNELVEFLAFGGIFIGSCFAGVIVTGLVMAAFHGIGWVLDKLKIMRQALFMAEILFPVVIISALVVWNEFGIHYIKEVVGRDAGLFTLIIALTITGFLPFRIISLFTPPVKGINIIIGLTALGFYLFSLSK